MAKKIWLECCIPPESPEASSPYLMPPIPPHTLHPSFPALVSSSGFPMCFGSNLLLPENDGSEKAGTRLLCSLWSSSTYLTPSSCSDMSLLGAGAEQGDFSILTLPHLGSKARNPSFPRGVQSTKYSWGNLKFFWPFWVEVQMERIPSQAE